MEQKTLKELLIMIKSLLTFFRLAIMEHGGESGQRPCNLNGGSPFLHTAKSRVTGPLFTGRGQPTYTHFGLAPLEQMTYRWASPHRVEQPSPESLTKENSVHSPPPLLRYFFHRDFSIASSLKRLVLKPFVLKPLVLKERPYV